MLSIVAAALLFTGCGEKAKDSATDAAAKAVESTKEAASHAVDATKEAADKAVEAAKETTAKAVDATKAAADKAVEATKEAADKAVEATKDAAATATEAVADTAKNVAGAAAYAKCAGCHGADGKTKALGKSPVIAGQSKADLVTKINGYKAGTINVAGMGNLMKGQVATMDDASIEAVATYISTLK
ncbi:MAG: c-type cytochrome [Sulfurovum sp.]|nr:c-type cytochrome [Sulfurovum sp.]